MRTSLLAILFISTIISTIYLGYFDKELTAKNEFIQRFIGITFTVTIIFGFLNKFIGLKPEKIQFYSYYTILFTIAMYFISKLIFYIIYSDKSGINGINFFLGSAIFAGIFYNIKGSLFSQLLPGVPNN